MFERILVPVDGSETSTRALIAALQLAGESGGRVRVLHALDELAYLSGYEYSGEMLAQARAQAKKVVEDAVALATSRGVAADSQLLEAPGRRLGEIVAEHARAMEADLVVVGTHGRRGINRLVVGSGAEQVIRMAPVPVLAVRTPEAPAQS
jgi:nucleotide-binding universal stress UspA family protein